jgi:hypothetical protein
MSLPASLLRSPDYPTTTAPYPGGCGCVLWDDTAGMSTHLPPELAELMAAYEDIFARYEAGQMSEEQARITVENRVTVDGAGSAWRINTAPDGEEFLCAPPGGGFSPRNAMYFQPLTHPAPGVQGGWGPQQAAPTGVPVDGWVPSSSGFTQDQPMPGFPGSPGQAPMGHGPGGHGPGGHGPTGQVFDPAAAWSQNPALTPQGAPGPVKSSGAGKVSGRLSALAAKLLADKRRLVVVVLLLVAALFFLSSRGGGNDSPDTDPTVNSVPVVPTPTAPPVTLPPVSEPGDTTDEGDVPSALPTLEDSARALTALTSGQTELAWSVIADSGPSPARYLAAAAWSGLATIGVSVEPQPAALAEDGRVLQLWLLNDTASGQAIGVADVVWSLGADGVWLLAAWPAVTEPR